MMNCLIRNRTLPIPNRRIRLLLPPNLRIPFSVRAKRLIPILATGKRPHVGGRDDGIDRNGNVACGRSHVAVDDDASGG